MSPKFSASNYPEISPAVFLLELPALWGTRTFSTQCEYLSDALEMLRETGADPAQVRAARFVAGDRVHVYSAEVLKDTIAYVITQATA